VTVLLHDRPDFRMMIQGAAQSVRWCNAPKWTRTCSTAELLRNNWIYPLFCFPVRTSEDDSGSCSARTTRCRLDEASLVAELRPQMSEKPWTFHWYDDISGTYTASSFRATLRHTEHSTYGCFLPDLTRFMGFCCEDSKCQHRLYKANLTSIIPLKGIQPR